jgi:hypothetical protein
VLHFDLRFNNIIDYLFFINVHPPYTSNICLYILINFDIEYNYLPV